MRPSTRILTLLLVSLLVETSKAQSPVERVESQSGKAWVTPEVKAPRVSFHTFDSDATKGKVSYHIYTPAAYDREPQRRFPVVYWLHGSGGGLAGLAKVAAHFNAAIEAGKTPPCFVVFVNGLVEGMYVDWKDGSAPMETNRATKTTTANAATDDDQLLANDVLGRTPTTARAPKYIASPQATRPARRFVKFQ